MGSKTDAFENAVLNIATGQAHGLTLPITPYVGLLTVAPTDSTAGTEATGGGYARVDSSGKWGAPSGGAVSNNATISFAQFSGSVSAGAAFVAFGIYTASSGGTMLYWGALDDITKTGGNGDTISIASGALTLTED